MKGLAISVQSLTFPCWSPVDEVIELALEERAVVEIIVREDLQKKFDGVGALLRWKI